MSTTFVLCEIWRILVMCDTVNEVQIVPRIDRGRIRLAVRTRRPCVDILLRAEY